METETLLKKALSLPLSSGVYIMRDAGNEIIYIGKAKLLRNRVSSYFRDAALNDRRVQRMVVHAVDFDVIVTDTEMEALMLEASLIKLHMPKYNILLKDDKGFSFVRISDEPYPRITAEFQKRADGAEYIGPYFSSFAVRRMVESANAAFRLPTCQRRFPESFGKYRPCLNSHIGLCMGVCAGRITSAEYQKSVANAVELITKGSDYMLTELRARMLAASENMDYERAAKYRDSINAIEKSQSKQKVIAQRHGEADFFAFAGNERSVLAAVLRYRGGVLVDKREHLYNDTADISLVRGELLAHYYLSEGDIPREIFIDAEFEDRELLARALSAQKGSRVAIAVPKKGDALAVINMAYENASDSIKRRFSRETRELASIAELCNLLSLSALPETIEAYDISNYGDDAVAGMVVYTRGRPNKNGYRRFKIKTVEGPDDYASMREVLSRRIARFDDPTSDGQFAVMPDVIFLDGGAGQVSAVWDIMKNSSFSRVPLFGLVKDDKHRTRGVVSVNGEISVPLTSNAFRFLASLQNEVHRFSLEYRRKSHSRDSFRSSLLAITGVGEQTARKLLSEFKTIANIKNASVDMLSSVDGVSRTAAENIYNHYREKK